MLSSSLAWTYIVNDVSIDWLPQPRQLTFLDVCGLDHPFTGEKPKPAKADVIGYGGAAGGGKSDALLLIGIIAGLTYPGLKVGYFRRKYTQLEGPGGAIMRAHELMNDWAEWHGGNRRWTLPTGSILEFCYCARENDVYNYQSSQFDIILFDEGTHFTEYQYRYMLTRNRATVKYEGFKPFVAIGTNPGGVGHQWFKKQFVDIGSPEEVHKVEIEGEGEEHIFIPAFLSDNLVLQDRDPNYESKLRSQGEIVRKQLLEGDWDAFAGQYFPEWRKKIHTTEEFEIPHHWKRFRSLDYGLDCTACYWWAVDGQGKLYIYRELHQPNLNLSQAAKKIRELTHTLEDISYTVASPDLWNRRQDTGKAGIEIMNKAGLTGLVKADNRRIPGWRVLREHLQPYEDEQGVLTAKIQIFNHCINAISNLPSLLHDENNPEDASDYPHDITHAPESIRYGVMSRPPIRSYNDEELDTRKRKREKMLASRDKITGY